MTELLASAPLVRLTRHREAVLTAIQARPVHLTAAEVYDQVRQGDPHIAYATIYNALHFLVDAGLIATVQRPDGVTSYDRTTDPHDHVQCGRCGSLADVERSPVIEVGDAYSMVAEQTGYRVEQHRIAFVGLCPSCIGMAAGV